MSRADIFYVVSTTLAGVLLYAAFEATGDNGWAATTGLFWGSWVMLVITNKNSGGAK